MQIYDIYTYNHYNYPDYMVRHLNLQDLEDLMIFPRSQSLSSQPETFSRVPFRVFFRGWWEDIENIRWPASLVSSPTQQMTTRH